MSRLLTQIEADEFKKLLSNYSLHEDGLVQFQASSFAIIAGPAGAGKDTLRNSLVKQYPELYVPILSTTTRPPREGEVDGGCYHFREVEAVQEGLAKREFFQAEVVHNQQISCLCMDEIRKLQPRQTGLSILITETEEKLTRIKQNIKTVFLIPPDLPTLLARIQTERMLNDEEIGRRLEAARNEIEYALKAKNYYCLINDTVEAMVTSAHIFFQEGTIDVNQDSATRSAMQQIANTLNDW